MTNQQKNKMYGFDENFSIRYEKLTKTFFFSNITTHLFEINSFTINFHTKKTFKNNFIFTSQVQ